MKISTPQKLPVSKIWLSSGLLSVLTLSSVQAAEIVKAPNTDSIHLATSWVGGLVPGAADIAIFDSTFTSGGSSVGFDASLAFDGLRVTGNTQNIVLAPSGVVPVLTLGSGGLDLSAATAGSKFTLEAGGLTAAAGTSSEWKVADSVTLHLKGAINVGVGSVVDMVTGTSGTILADVPTGNLPILLNNTDLASVITEDVLDEFGNPILDDFTGLPITQKRVVSSVQNAAGNTSNPVGDPATLMPTPALTAAGYAGMLDFRNQYANDGTTPLQGMTIPNGGFISGFRFSVPNMRTDGVEEWNVSHNSGTNTPRTTTPRYGVIVTDGVGTDNVVFGGNFYFRIDNASDSNRLILHQDNPAGDLIFRNTSGINARNAAAAHIVKSGRGRVIIENGVGANNGLYIYEGTMTFGAGGTVGNPGSGPIINNGSLVFNRSDLLTVGGIISGSGTLTKQGAGTLSLTGANTFTGLSSINAGAVSLGNASALGQGDISFAGGGVVYADGITTDLSLKGDGLGGLVPRAVTLASGTTAIDVGTNNVTYVASIGQGGSGGLAKSGSGSLTLSGANNYSGNTSVNAGTLVVANTAGSATGSGSSISVASSATLMGSGTVAGVVSMANGAILSPGAAGVGNITLGGLSLGSGSVVNLEFASPSSHDTIATTNNNGLTLNGGNVRLYQPGTTTGWVPVAGVYNVATYQGAVQGTGVGSLAVTNPAAGYGYTFSASSGALQMTVALEAILTQWLPAAGGSWGGGANWSNGVPAGGYTAQLTTNQSGPALVTLDGNRTVNGMVFNSTTGGGYTIASGTGGTLTLSKTTGNVAVNVTAGEHAISAPVALSSSMAVTTADASGLTLSGVVSGAGGVVKEGPGYLNLTGANTFTGAISVFAGDIRFSQASGLGSGALTLDGGAISYNAGNTTDLSGRTITIGTFGGTINTGGNDVNFANPIGNGGDGALSKAGAGILTLSGSNTYKGGTQILGGSVRIGSNANLGLPVEGSSLTLNGGGLIATSTISLDNAGANARNVAIDGTGGTIDVVGEASTVTIAGAIRGSGELTKAGTGTLVLSGDNNFAAGEQFTGAIKLNAGKLVAGGVAANGQRALGTGAIAFGNNTTLQLNGAGLADDNTNYGNFFNAIDVPAGVTATLLPAPRLTVSSPLTGAGVLNVQVAATRQDYTGNWAAYTGRLNLTGAGEFRLTNFQNNVFNGADLHIGEGVMVYQNFNPPSGTGTETIQNIGALSGPAGSMLSGQLVSGRFVNWSIGARNSDTEFAGVISDRTLPNTPPAPLTYGQTRLTKVGTGTLTLSGVNTYTSTTTVNAGTLKVNGSLAGRPADSAYSSVSVAAGATLAGSGTIAGPVLVSGVLHPSQGDEGVATLTFGNTLALTGTTQIDFVGATHDQVISTQAGGLTYGGTLAIGFEGNIYNGDYQLFQFTSPVSGSFSAVTVASTPSPVDLTDPELDGTWVGTMDGAVFTFNATTGRLLISGGQSAVTPGTPSLAVNSVGDASVSLGWGSVSGGDTYLVKRSNTPGGPYTTVQSGIATTSYTDVGLVNNTTYYYVVQGVHGSGLTGANSNEVSATPVSVPVHTALETWRFDQFGVYTDDGTVLAGNTEDFDGDGLVNILEYALATDPTVANASPVVVARNGNNLTLTYPRLTPADPALEYTVQASSDLTGAFVTGPGGSNTVGSTTTYTDNVDVSVAGVRRFLRLSVTYTAP